MILRAYVERCNYPAVLKLITLGSPHGGISELPVGPKSLRKVAYSKFAQKNVVPAQYFRDGMNLEKYLRQSSFISDINNEKTNWNRDYADRMKTLKKLVLIMYQNDSVLVPRESAWFAVVGNNGRIIPWNKNRMFGKEDRLGLSYLNKNNRTAFWKLPGGHLDYIQNATEFIIETYLKDE